MSFSPGAGAGAAANRAALAAAAAASAAALGCSTRPADQTGAGPGGTVVLGGATAQPMPRHVLWGGIESQSGSEASRSSAAASHVRTAQAQSQGTGMGFDARERDKLKLLQRGYDPNDMHFNDESFDSLFESPCTGSLAAPGAVNLASSLAKIQQDRDRDGAKGNDEDFSDSGDSDFDSLTIGQQVERQQQLLRQMVPGSDLEALKSQVPLDESGQPTSIGSMLHASGMCKVCVLAHSGTCPHGVLCSFCHLPHRRARRKNAMRPCKGKRDRYRRLVTRLEHEIEIDPDGFDVNKVELPPSIVSNEIAHAKLLAKLQSRLEQEKAKRQMQRRLAAGGAVPAQAPSHVQGARRGQPSTRVSL